MRFVFILIVFLVVNVFLGWNGFVYVHHFARNVHNLSIIYWMVFTVVAFSYLLARLPLLQNPVGRLLKVIGSYYFAILEFAILMLPIVDLVSGAWKRFGKLPSDYVPIVGTLVASVILVLVIWGSRNAFSPVTRTYVLDVDKRAGGMKQLRIAMASDIHLGNIVGKRHLRRLLRHIKEIRPDLILLPGDVIDDSIEPFLRNRMAETLQELSAPFGIYAVLGNHEYYGGHIEEYVDAMNHIGIHVLRDESVLVEDCLYVVGRKDKTAESMDPAGRLPLSELVAGLDASLPLIVMDHQPYAFDQAANVGTDILLCGHTHRGQFAPNLWITKRLFELDWGYLRKQHMHVIVSSGFGLWGPPIRLASRSEVIEVVVNFTGA